MDIVGLASDGNVTVDISTHDGALGGLKLGGDLVKSTADELNLLDAGATVGAEGPFSCVSRWARAIYDFSSDGGARADIPLDCVLPDNSQVLSAFVDIETTMTVDGGASQGGLTLGHDGDRDAFLTATDGHNYAGGRLALCSPPVALLTPNREARTVSVTFLGSADVTAGKFSIFFEYIIVAD